MHDFLRNEWKTILIVTIFCAIIYGWFYVQDREKKPKHKNPTRTRVFAPADRSLNTPSELKNPTSNSRHLPPVHRKQAISASNRGPRQKAISSSISDAINSLRSSSSHLSTTMKRAHASATSMNFSSLTLPSRSPSPSKTAPIQLITVPSISSDANKTLPTPRQPTHQAAPNPIVGSSRALAEVATLHKSAHNTCAT